MAAKKKPARKPVARTWSGPEALEPLLIKVDEVSEDPKNARLHNERNLESIRASLEKFGQMKPIVVRDGIAVAGNGTLAAARTLGWSHLAAVDASMLTEDEARAYAIADNRTSELAEWDYRVLAETFRDLKAVDINLDVTGFIDSEVGPLLDEHFSTKEKPKLAESAKHGSDNVVVMTVEQRTRLTEAMGKHEEATGTTLSRGEFVDLLVMAYIES